MISNPRKTNPEDSSANRDAITGTPGSHPIGTGIGAAGAGAAGAAIGAAAGPIGSIAGAAIGTVIGAVAGGLAGKGVAEAINPTAEDAYWRENYRTRPYATGDVTYDEFRPFYEYGWNATNRYAGQNFEDVEPQLQSEWERTHPDIEWDEAAPAVRDSFERVTVRRVGSRKPVNM
ncbi:MAG: hypothetical protein M3O30_05360 [Planctomycetota bacterium]|nr:hypothetical protein [Planctomycetota bacterium]